MIRQRTTTSITCAALAALIGLAGAGAAAAETVTLFRDGFEDANSPRDKWDLVQGCPYPDPKDPIDESQSLRVGFGDDCQTEEPDLICGNMEWAPGETLVSVSASFRINVQELALPLGTSFEIFALFEEQQPDRQAVAVRLGNNHGQLWVALEAMDNWQRVVSSPRRGLDRILSETYELLLQITWSRGQAGAPGSASLDVDGLSPALSFDLSGLVNDTLEPDYVRVGVDESDVPLGGFGSFLLDDFELRTFTVN